MAYIKRRKHPALRTATLKPAAALTALALGSTAALADDTVLPQVNVTGSSDYKVDQAASTKYTAPLVDTPKTITVIPQRVIEETNATTLQDALRTTPGITIAHGEGGVTMGDNLTIRGFNASNNTYVDGLRDPGSQSRNIFAVESVEVVKGPDSAFSGGGAVGGSVNLVTKSAHLGNSNEVSFGLGTDSYLRGTADINRQISDTAAVRLNLLKETGDVPGRNEVDYDHLGANLSAAFGLGTATRVTAGLYHYETDDMPDYGIPFKYSTTVSGPYNYSGSGSVIDVNRDNFYGLKGRDFQKTNVDSGTLKIEHDLDDKWTIRNATRYTKSKNDYIATTPGDSRGWFNADPTPLNASDTATSNNASGQYLLRSQKSHNTETEAWVNDTQLSGEFLTGEVKHNVTFGVEFTHVETDTLNYTVTGNSYANIANPNPNDPWTGTVARATAGNKITTNISGIYAFDTLTLNKQWLINLGLRRDTFRSFMDYYTTNGATPTTADLHTNSSFNSYQTGLVFKPKDNGSVYLTYASSANPSGVSIGGDNIDTASATNKDLEPEKVKSIEFGTKWNLLNNKLSLTASLFRLEKTNAKVTVATNVVATVGKQKNEGYELGFAGNLTDKWQIFGGYTHQDSELEDAGPLGTANNGKQFVNTPKDSFSLWTTYKIIPKLTVGGGANYVSKVYSDVANTKWLPSYTVYSAMASYDWDKQLSFRLNVQNLTDKTYYYSATSPHMASVGSGRQVVLTANYKF